MAAQTAATNKESYFQPTLLALTPGAAKDAADTMWYDFSPSLATAPISTQTTLEPVMSSENAGNEAYAVGAKGWSIDVSMMGDSELVTLSTVFKDKEAVWVIVPDNTIVLSATNVARWCTGVVANLSSVVETAKPPQLTFQISPGPTNTGIHFASTRNALVGASPNAGYTNIPLKSA